MAIYLDCNATTPIEPQVRDRIGHYFDIEFGNAGSRTHDFGIRAQQAVQKARDQVAAVVKAKREEVIFTSGATESNNMAILGLAEYGEMNGRKHIISTMVEHKAVLEPLEFLRKRGFEVTLLSPNKEGWVEPETLKFALREDTLLISIMQVNNETGAIQPIPEYAKILAKHPTFFHVDAAQGFGKDILTLQNPRIDLISISGHKIYAPKGIGSLIARRRGFTSIPLQPIVFGGGQERGLRPGTLPVPLIVGLGLAAELALRNAAKRAEVCKAFKQNLLAALMPFEPVIHGNMERTVSHTVSLAFTGLDSEAVMLAVKDYIAVSNGSACTSHSYQPSHVLKAMNIDDTTIQGTIRMSWCHMTEEPDWDRIVKAIKLLL